MPFSTGDKVILHPDMKQFTVEQATPDGQYLVYDDEGRRELHPETMLAYEGSGAPQTVIVAYITAPPGEWTSGPTYLGVAANQSAGVRMVARYLARGLHHVPRRIAQYGAQHAIDQGYFRLQETTVEN